MLSPRIAIARTVALPLAAASVLPSGTSIGLSVRVGRSTTPDATWSAWTPAGIIASLPRTGYAQVVIAFPSPTWDVTPAVTSVTLTYMPGTGGL